MVNILKRKIDIFLILLGFFCFRRVERRHELWTRKSLQPIFQAFDVHHLTRKKSYIDNFVLTDEFFHCPHPVVVVRHVR